VRAGELWRQAYEGEVLGEALFSALAERTKEPERRRQLEVLALLERSTKELALPVVDRRGIACDVEAIRRAAGELADAVQALAWDDFLGSFQPVISDYLARYCELVELAEDQEERTVAEAYVDHELALESFLRRALGREPGEPSQPILDLPHVAAALA
jgi:hypothetical protein